MGSTLKTCFFLLACLLAAPASAMADVPPDLEAGRRFVDHALAIQNMDEHPRYAIVVYDAPSRDGLIRAHRVYSGSRDSRQVLTRGGSWRSRQTFAAPGLYLVPVEAARRWEEATAREIERQRDACDERGEGCVHISRFSPRYAPPRGAVSCGVELDVVYDRAGDGPAEVVDTFRLVTATHRRCVVERVGAPVAAADERDRSELPLVVVFGCAGLVGLGVLAGRRRAAALA